jgi:hypothetical protein
MNRMKQQGDILFLEVKNIPCNAKKINSLNGKYVLASGESTGHSHSVLESDSVEVFESDGVLYLSSTTPVEINHEEHHKVTLDGVWEIGRVVEIDPFDEEIRRIAD